MLLRHSLGNRYIIDRRLCWEGLRSCRMKTTTQQPIGTIWRACWQKSEKSIRVCILIAFKFAFTDFANYSDLLSDSVAVSPSRSCLASFHLAILRKVPVLVSIGSIPKALHLRFVAVKDLCPYLGNIWKHLKNEKHSLCFVQLWWTIQWIQCISIQSIVHPSHSPVTLVHTYTQQLRKN